MTTDNRGKHQSDDPDHNHGKSCGCDIHHGITLIAIKWPEAVGDEQASEANGRQVMAAMAKVLPTLVEAMPEGATIVSSGAEMIQAIAKVAPAHKVLLDQQVKAAASARLN